jgi:hypothetical protein
VLIGISGTAGWQWVFSQSAAMNRFFGTAPLYWEELGICALPMLPVDVNHAGGGRFS